MSSLNRGAAPAYQPYKVFVRLRGCGKTLVQLLEESNPPSWQPEVPVTEQYSLRFPAGFPAGMYYLDIGMRQSAQNDARPIWLGLQKDFKTSDGYYRIGTVKVQSQLTALISSDPRLLVDNFPENQPELLTTQP